MIPALLLLAGLALAEPVPGSDDWVAPAELSSMQGELHVDFVPRYPDARRATELAHRDLVKLEAELEQMDEAARAQALQRVSLRMEAVLGWQQRVADSLHRSQVGALEHASLQEVHTRLETEAATLRLQRRMLGAQLLPAAHPPVQRTPSPALRHDAIGFFEDVVVARGDIVQEALAFGGDVVIEGRVLSDAIAFGGDVYLRPEAEVLGDLAAFGGRVHVDGGRLGGHRTELPGELLPTASADPGSPDIGLAERLRRMLIPLLTLSGLSMLTVGLVPSRVEEVSESLRDRPVLAVVAGAVGTAALTLSSMLFAITVVGLPVAVLIFVMVGSATLLGLAGLSHAVGARFSSQGSRWSTLVSITAVAALLTVAPAAFKLVAMLGVIGGIGGTYLSRFGRA